MSKRAGADKTTAKNKSSKKDRKAEPSKKSIKADASKKSGKKKAEGKKASKDAASAPAVDVVVDSSLFAPLADGERAEALRILCEDPRLSTMANIGRFRVLAVEPLVVKPSHPLAGRRLARIVIYDYAADRSVDGNVDLDTNRVTHLNVSRAQPLLAPEEEALAIAIALADERVKEQLSLGEEPRVAAQYWSHDDTNLSYSRRSAAVIFGRADNGPSLVAVVDLLDNLVCEIVPAAQW